MQYNGVSIKVFPGLFVKPCINLLITETVFNWANVFSASCVAFIYFFRFQLLQGDSFQNMNLEGKSIFMIKAV